MVVDIRGVSLNNKGAHLMMLAIVDRLGDRVELSMPPESGDFRLRGASGVLSSAYDYRFQRLSLLLGDRLPMRYKERFGIVSDHDITGVLDASGFAYSDSFALARIEREAVFGERWSKRNVPKVMLPQAFGPLDDKEKRDAARRVLAGAQLIYARDDRSADYLADVAPNLDVRRCPDFTIGLPGREFDVPFADFGAVVPNLKLVSSGVVSAADYHQTLVKYTKAVAAVGLEPVVVIHEDRDAEFAEDVAGETGCQVFRDEDPLVLKTVLSLASIVVASRFHAVVSALAGGTPTVAIGWSHKYLALLGDFGVEHWLTDAAADPDDRVRAVLSDDAGRRIIAARKSVLLEQVDEMWRGVVDALGLSKRP